MFISVAHAMGSTGIPQGGADAFMQFVPLILMLVIFYFLLIRPQQKRAKTHKAMLDALKKGNQVLTSGGLIGRIIDIDGDELVIDLGETKVTIGRAYVVNLLNREQKPVKEPKPAKAAKPITTKLAEAAKQAEVAKPEEEAKPAEEAKPVEEAKPEETKEVK